MSRVLLPTVAELAQDPTRAGELAPEQVPPLMAQLAALQSALAARLLQNSHPQAPAPPDRLLTAEQAAQRLSMTAAQVRDRCRTGRLPGFREGKRWYVPVRALDAWLAGRLAFSLDTCRGNTLHSPPDARHGVARPPSAEAVSIVIRRAARGPRDGEEMRSERPGGARAGQVVDPTSRRSPAGGQREARRRVAERQEEG